MIAAAIVCAAAFAHAATCTWGSGNMYGAADADGGWATGSANLIKNRGEVTMQVFLLADEAAYNALATKTQAELYEAYKDKSTPISGTSKNPTSGAIGNAVTITEENSFAGVEYAVVIATYTDSTLENKEFYIANVVKSTYNTVKGTGSAANTISSVANWQAVPEPTSGLLLLLGVAGLALRRRRA